MGCSKMGHGIFFCSANQQCRTGAFVRCCFGSAGVKDCQIVALPWPQCCIPRSFMSVQHWIWV